MNEKYKSWLKKFGVAGFLFFLIKGILWLIFGAALYQWLKSLFICFGFVFLIHSNVYSQIAKNELFRFKLLNKKYSSYQSYFQLEGYKSKAFTCRLEDKINAKRKFHYKFRLGSLDYTNSLEYPRTYPEKMHRLP